MFEGDTSNFFQVHNFDFAFFYQLKNPQTYKAINPFPMLNEH